MNSNYTYQREQLRELEYGLKIMSWTIEDEKTRAEIETALRHVKLARESAKRSAGVSSKLIA